jgi:hypothetical protein
MTANGLDLQYRETFSQRNGYEMIPLPLNPGEMPYLLRHELADVLETEYEKSTDNASNVLKFAEWNEIFARLWVRKFGQQRTFGQQALCKEKCKSIILHKPFHEVLTLLEWFAFAIGEKQASFQKEINIVLTAHKAPYILYHSPKNNWLVIQTGSEIERHTVLECLTILQDPTFVIPKEHFEKAGHWLIKENFAESVGQVFKALEACLKILSGNLEATGGDALKAYVKQFSLPPPLQELIRNLWRYRNEAEDVGHSKKENASTPSPDRWTAQFLYVQVAYCLSFLINRWQENKK